MPKVTMVQHVNVQIRDRQRTREWYEQVLGATFRDRGPERNKRQLQLHLGNAEMHFTEMDNPVISPRAHFAVEVENWDDMLAHFDALGIAYSRTGPGAFNPVSTGNDPRWGKSDDTGEHYTYIHDPDGNKIEIASHPRGLRWRQLPEVEAALGKCSAP